MGPFSKKPTTKVTDVHKKVLENPYPGMDWNVAEAALLNQLLFAADSAARLGDSIPGRHHAACNLMATLMTFWDVTFAHHLPYCAAVSVDFRAANPDFDENMQKMAIQIRDGRGKIQSKDFDAKCREYITHPQRGMYAIVSNLLANKDVLLPEAVAENWHPMDAYQHLTILEKVKHNGICNQFYKKN